MADNNLNYEPVTTEPISEIGKELYALLGNEVELEEPISEIGKILYAMLGYEVEIPEPKSVIARLLYQYYLEGGGDIPEELITEMNAVLNKKFGTSTTYLPNTWADNVNLLGKLPTKTASGSIANFVDGADDVPVAEGVFNIVATQAGTGDPSPSNPREISGFNAASITKTGVNIWGGQKLADDIVSLVTGAYISPSLKRVTYTGQNINNVVLFNKFKPNTRYTFFISAVSGVSNLKFFYTDNTSQMINNTGVTISNPDKSVSYIGGSWNTGTTVLNFEECGVLEGELTIDDFEPYNANVYNVDWTTEAGTVYGGSLNLTTGVLTVTNILKVYDGSNDEEWSISGTGTANYFYNIVISPNSKGNTVISNMYSRNAIYSNNTNQGIFETINNLRIRYGEEISLESFRENLSNTPLQVVYELATPITYQLTPQELRTFKANNNIWSDTGDSAIQYRADIDLIINS